MCSRTDWLPIDNTEEISELFTRLVPNPTAGQNASRHEVLLTAYASGVVVMALVALGSDSIDF